jgi:hypothetical protein
LLKKKEERKHHGYNWPGVSRQQKAFLNAYITGGSVSSAHQLTRLSRRNHYNWLKSEPYQEAYEDATKILLEELEAELHQRAAEGLHEPVIYQGTPMHAPKRNERGQILMDANGHTVYEDSPMYIRRPSDVLLMFRLKKLDPSYRENSKVEVTGQGGAPLSIKVEFVKPE